MTPQPTPAPARRVAVVGFRRNTTGRTLTLNATNGRVTGSIRKAVAQ